MRQVHQLNDHKMTLSPTTSNVPHICVTSIHESQMSLRFTLRLAVFEIQGILKIVHGMTQHDLEPCKVEFTLYMCYWYQWVPNVSTFRSTTNRFRDTGNFETSALNDPKITLNPTRSKVAIYVLLMTQSPNFYPTFLYDLRFRDI